MESNRANLEGVSHGCDVPEKEQSVTYLLTHTQQIPTLCMSLTDIPSSCGMLKLHEQGWTGHWMCGWTDHWMCRWTDHWMCGWTGHWMCRWIGHWMCRWTGHWMCLLLCKLSCHAPCSFIAHSCLPHKYVQAACKSISSYTVHAT